MKDLAFPQVLWSRQTTAKYLGLSTKTVDRLIRQNRIRAFKVGRKVLIYAETVSEENINSIKPNFLN